jgi:uncharacterized protein YqeY
MTTLKAKLNNDIKDAMRARDKRKLDTLRLISAAVKQIEVDERIEVDDARMLTLLTKMSKQRHESISHYAAAKRDDLIEQENYELSIIQAYLPAPLTEQALHELIDNTFAQMTITHIRDMGPLMAQLKPQIEGRADVGHVSALVKTKLNAVLG